MSAELIGSLSQAIGIASRLKAIGENIKDAEFKNLLADLSLELADMKLQMAAVLDEKMQLRAQLREWESHEADPCPKCKKRTWELEGSKENATFGRLGVIERVYRCSACGYFENKLVTP